MPGRETVWINGRIRTMDSARPWATAMLVRDGAIVHVGDDADILAAASPGARHQNLHGRFALSSLIDSHTHALWCGRHDPF